jgi:hypothetical protein
VESNTQIRIDGLNERRNQSWEAEIMFLSSQLGFTELGHRVYSGMRAGLQLRNAVQGACVRKTGVGKRLSMGMQGNRLLNTAL